MKQNCMHTSLESSCIEKKTSAQVCEEWARFCWPNVSSKPNFIHSHAGVHQSRKDPCGPTPLHQKEILVRSDLSQGEIFILTLKIKSRALLTSICSMHSLARHVIAWKKDKTIIWEVQGISRLTCLRPVCSQLFWRKPCAVCCLGKYLYPKPPEEA